MKLFIANTTKHHQEFLYRLPEDARSTPMRQIIRVGEQVQIYQDTTKDVLEHILKQHMDAPKPFLIPESEAARYKGFIGLIYSFDKPVTATKIEDAFEKNDGELKKQGDEQRKEAALATNAGIEGQAENTGATVNAVDVTIIEQTKEGQQPTGNELNEKITVDKPGRKNR